MAADETIDTTIKFPIKNIATTYILPTTVNDTVIALGLDPDLAPPINKSFYQIIEGEGASATVKTIEIGTRCNPLQADGSDPCSRALGSSNTCEAVSDPSTEVGLSFYKETCLFNETCLAGDKSEKVLCQDSCLELYNSRPHHYNCGSSITFSSCNKEVFISRCEAERECGIKDINCNYKKACLFSQGNPKTAQICKTNRECASQKCFEYKYPVNGTSENLGEEEAPPISWTKRNICEPVYQCVRKCSDKGDRISTAGCCPGLIEDGGICVPVNIDGVEPNIQSSIVGASCKIKMWDASGTSLAVEKKLEEGTASLEKVLKRNVFLAENYMRGFEWLFSQSGTSGGLGEDRWGFNTKGKNIAQNYSEAKGKIKSENSSVRKTLAENRCRFLAQKGDGNSDQEYLNRCLEDVALDRPFAIEGSPVATSNLTSATAVYKMLSEEAAEDAKYYEKLRKYYGISRSESGMRIEPDDFVGQIYNWNRYTWNGGSRGFDKYGESSKWISIKRFWIKIYSNIAGEAAMPGIRNKFCVRSCWNVYGGKMVDALYHPGFFNHEPSHIKVSYLNKFEEQVSLIAEQFQIEDLILSPAYAAELGGSVSYRRERSFASEKQAGLLLERMKSLYKIYAEEKTGKDHKPREAVVATADDLLEIFSEKTELGKKLRDPNIKVEELKKITPEMRAQYLQHYIGSQAMGLWSRYGSTTFPGYNLRDSVSNNFNSGASLGGGASGIAFAAFTGLGVTNLAMGAIGAIGSAFQGSLDPTCAYQSNGSVKGKATNDIYFNSRYIGEFYREYAKAKQEQSVCYMKLATKMDDNYARNNGVTIVGSQLNIPKAPNLKIDNPEKTIAIDRTCKSGNCPKAPGDGGNTLNGITFGGSMNWGNTSSVSSGGDPKLGTVALGDGSLGDGNLGNFAVGKVHDLDANGGSGKDVRDPFDNGLGRNKSTNDLISQLSKSKNPDNKNLAKMLSATTTSGVGSSLNLGEVANLGIKNDKNAFDYNKFMSDMQKANAAKAGSGIDVNKYKNAKGSDNATEENKVAGQEPSTSAHGLGNEEVDRILDATSRHKSKYIGDQADDIFKKISKTYVRSAYPVLLIKKKD